MRQPPKHPGLMDSQRGLQVLSKEQVLQQVQGGALLLDVRTPQEFALGHLPGAWNLPWMFGSNLGLFPNPEFVKLAQASLPQGRLLVVSCHSGGRARSAAVELLTAGYTVAVDHCGWGGCRDAFGRLTPGWKEASTLPPSAVSVTYEELKCRAQRA